MDLRTSCSRRRFLAATAATAAFGPSLLRAEPAKERLNIAFVGYGKRAYAVMGQAMREKDVRIVAVCDVEGTRRAMAKEVVEKKYAEEMKSGAYKGCDAYTDYRELLQRDDLGAVVIMTPDHMHVHVIRGHDHHRTEIIALEQLAVVGVGIAALVCAGFHFLGILFLDHFLGHGAAGSLHIADRHDPYILFPHGLAHDRVGPFAVSDKGDVQPFLRWLGTQQGWAEGGGRSGGCKETAA